MNSRSKKYHEARKSNKKNKDTSAARTDERANRKAGTAQKENSATQDDTSGGNDSGKRSDEN